MNATTSAEEDLTAVEQVLAGDMEAFEGLSGAGRVR